ncbi:MAG: hypothetical protein ACRYFU_05490 [Janthinobacterium lividum]
MADAEAARYAGALGSGPRRDFSVGNTRGSFHGNLVLQLSDLLVVAVADLVDVCAEGGADAKGRAAAYGLKGGCRSELKRKSWADGSA